MAKISGHPDKHEKMVVRTMEREQLDLQVQLAQHRKKLLQKLQDIDYLREESLRHPEPEPEPELESESEPESEPEPEPEPAFDPMRGFSKPPSATTPSVPDISLEFPSPPGLSELSLSFPSPPGKVKALDISPVMSRHNSEDEPDPAGIGMTNADQLSPVSKTIFSSLPVAGSHKAGTIGSHNLVDMAEWHNDTEGLQPQSVEEEVQVSLKSEEEVSLRSAPGTFDEYNWRNPQEAIAALTEHRRAALEELGKADKPMLGGCRIRLGETEADCVEGKYVGMTKHGLRSFGIGENWHTVDLGAVRFYTQNDWFYT